MTIEVKTRARFVYTPFSPETMRTIAQTLIDKAIKPRIQAAENVNDQPARLLKPGKNGKGGYIALKAKRGEPAIRDWTFTGNTLSAMGVADAAENHATIGFLDDKADRVAHYNNLREVQFGLSPKDHTVLDEQISEHLKDCFSSKEL